MRRIVMLGCALLLLAGCATLQNKDQSLDATLEAYRAALRWGDMASAWQYVDPAVRAAHPLTPQQKAAYAGVSVAEYETPGPVATGADTVNQTAQVSFIDKSSQRVFNVLDHQTWRWDAQARRWWLESGLPDIEPAQ